MSQIKDFTLSTKLMLNRVSHVIVRVKEKLKLFNLLVKALLNVNCWRTTVVTIDNLHITGFLHFLFQDACKSNPGWQRIPAVLAFFQVFLNAICYCCRVPESDKFKKKCFCLKKSYTSAIKNTGDAVE